MSAIEAAVIDVAPDVATYTITVATNEDWVRSFQITEGGEPIRLDESWSLHMQMAGTNGVALNATLENGRFVVVDRDEGKFSLRVAQSAASQISPGSYNYDIVLIAGDDVFRIVRGTILVEQGVTIVPGNEKWTVYPLISRP